MGGRQSSSEQQQTSDSDYQRLENEQPKSKRQRTKGAASKAKQIGKEEARDVWTMVTGIRWFPYGEIQVHKELDEDGMLFKNTVELQENPLTALFLCVSSDIWQRFPTSMQIVFMLSVVLGVGLQWISTVAIWLYLTEERRDMQSEGDDDGDDGEEDESDDFGQSEVVRVVGTFLSSAMLFLYLLGAVRVAFKTWQVALPRLGRDNLGWFVAANLFGDILLHLFVALVCVMAISTQDNISDKLQASLAFFFICEVDEWIYIFFIQPFDVLDSEDFIIVDEMDAEAQEREKNGESRIDVMWDLRARRSIRWGCVLFGFMIWSVVFSGFRLDKSVF